ncbi:sigma 54-interacting transcriptional regulator [Clostridium sp. PL3]|uniref:Sigma 54-interacting transcriptional regulator n=1 Tax=Clostridium thailandense TaxID=2794346 RepID=A0A949TY11_9CLOT|nr:sigma 54-interacting transcriptional regulator [Clostridium thailandense]MBV7275681.1 sigma 54-interacting transcriptional regulator [Clostridium thailandense]
MECEDTHVKSISIVESLLNNECFDNHFQGLLAIDLKGEVFFCNSFFLSIFGLSENQIIGKKINDVIPNCRLYDTIIQDSSQWGEILRLNNREFVIGRYPLKEQGQTVGAVLKTLFPNMIIAKEVSKKIANTNCWNDSSIKLHTCMDIIGESSEMLFTKKLARRAARSTSNLLVTGESGTGKSLIAEAIHSRSVRRDAPFIKINCAAIPETLLESELFGYEEGAFTGARRSGKAGKFELAKGGTIFLDEIGDMPLHMQAKLLQAIQDKQVERVGGTKTISVDIRIISATNKNLESLVKENKFREDLYYRLKVLEIRMPALREIKEDIPLYIESLLAKINKKLSSDAIGITNESLKLLKSYNWPGNVRELENFLELAVNYSDEEIIDITKLPEKPWDKQKSIIDTKGISEISSKDYNEIIDKTEIQLIIEAIKKCNGNKSKAAKMLNMHRSVLYKKLKRLNINL